jgi:GNAT superfamily N-acetyltransferase
MGSPLKRDPLACYNRVMMGEPLITTYLEMRSPDQLRPRHADARFQVRERNERDWQFNRDLYFLVGEGWDWIDRRPWTDEQWKEYATAPELRTFAAYYDQSVAGYYELRQDAQGAIEIAYFGLLPQFIGRGLGAALLTSAIQEAWRRRGGKAPDRVWVHTCNRDHPQALANYQARGMVIYKVEKAP